MVNSVAAVGELSTIALTTASICCLQPSWVCNISSPMKAGFLALTEDDRLHTQEVQRIWNLVKDDLKPTRLFNAAIGALSELSERAAAI